MPDGTLYVFGGADGGRYDTIECLDQAQNKWTVLNVKLHERMKSVITMMVTTDEIAIIGGEPSCGVSGQVSILNTKTGMISEQGETNRETTKDYSTSFRSGDSIYLLSTYDGC
jgi:hypothetical protein